MNIKQFKESPEPFRLPNNQDLFSWSMPFIVSKVTEMMMHITENINRENIIESEEDAQD